MADSLKFAYLGPKFQAHSLLCLYTFTMWIDNFCHHILGLTTHNHPEWYVDNHKWASPNQRYYCASFTIHKHFFRTLLSLLLVLSDKKAENGVFDEHNSPNIGLDHNFICQIQPLY